jgi:YHYH protein
LRTAAALAIAATVIAPTVSAHDRRPLGDGKVSDVARRGYILACDTRFPGGGGAMRQGEWIGQGTWDSAAKPYVEGNVMWPNARITIRAGDTKRFVIANNLPKHATGEFPVKPGTKAYDYDPNPNRIAPQNVLLTLPLKPVAASTPGCVPMGMIGFAVSGVAIFNAFDLGGRDAPAYEIQDRCNGHPERNSRYHYHDWSPCLRVRNPDEPAGWMLDGFPILGPIDGNGHVYKNADLDACHGRVGRVLIDGKWVETYHYRFTYEFPYTIGCYRGTPVRVIRR